MKFTTPTLDNFLRKAAFLAFVLPFVLPFVHFQPGTMETEIIRESVPSRPKGLMGRLRRNKISERSSVKKAIAASPISTGPVSGQSSVTREGVPVLTSKNVDQFNPSDVHQTEPAPKGGVFRRKNRSRQEVILEKPPAAREAAFAGPPRYDWIDIVSSIRRHSDDDDEIVER